MKRIENVLDKLGYSYDFKEENKGKWYGLIEFWTDTAGHDIPTEIYFDGTAEDFVAQFREAADNYDVDEEVDLYAEGRGKRGIPDSYSVLLKDMQEAKDTLMDIADKLEAGLNGKETDNYCIPNTMNKMEFMTYIDENYSIDGSAKRLIRNILDYVETHIVEENEQYLALCELLDGTIGLSDTEMKKICL